MVFIVNLIVGLSFFFGRFMSLNRMYPLSGYLIFHGMHLLGYVLKMYMGPLIAAVDTFVWPSGHNNGNITRRPNKRHKYIANL